MAEQYERLYLLEKDYASLEKAYSSCKKQYCSPDSFWKKGEFLIPTAISIFALGYLAGNEWR